MIELVYNVRLLRYARSETGLFDKLNASHLRKSTPLLSEVHKP